MTLSFVASAVQTGTSDGGFEEIPIESEEIETLNKRNANKPLFEQLRNNKDGEDAKNEEMERDIMRATCALDSEDVAHLDSINKQRTERERKIHERTQLEVDTFRAAKAFRQQTTTLAVGDLDEDDVNNNHTNSNTNNEQQNPKSSEQKDERYPSSLSYTNTMTMQSLMPVIKVKKRRRRQVTNENSSSPKKIKEASIENDFTIGGKISTENSALSDKNKRMGKDSVQATPSAKNDSTNCGGLSSLLSGYGSSSSED